MRHLHNKSKEDWDNLDLENYNKGLTNFILALGCVAIVIGIGFIIWFT